MREIPQCWVTGQAAGIAAAAAAAEHKEPRDLNVAKLQRLLLAQDAFVRLLSTTPQ
ncbi:MAG: FAD-dependent oxidoreductase [Pigmentiphaga sp.]